VDNYQATSLTHRHRTYTLISDFWFQTPDCLFNQELEAGIRNYFAVGEGFEPSRSS